MKKILLTIILATLTTTIVNASERKYKIFNVGAKVGINTAKLSNLKSFEKAWKTGYTFGTMFEIRPARFISIAAEVLYSKRDYTASSTIDNGSINLDAKLGTIDIPVLLRWYIADGFNIYAGVTPSYTINSKVEINSLNIANDVKFKTSTVAIPVGLGYHFRFGLLLDARYNIGVTKGALEDATGANIANAYINSFTFMVGWRF